MASRWASSRNRPSDLAEGVLSQCGTILTLRLNNDRDQAFVRAAMPEGSRGFLDSIPALRNRECIVSGEGVAIPIRVHPRRSGNDQAPRLERSRLLRSLARDGRRGRDDRPRRASLAQPGALTHLPDSVAFRPRTRYRARMTDSAPDRPTGRPDRRTFAIISHPDAGKTTLTEKLLSSAARSIWRAR
nr:Elongation factor Tu GTP binding domain protein [uncultured bacterium]